MRIEGSSPYNFDALNGLRRTAGTSGASGVSGTSGTAGTDKTAQPASETFKNMLDSLNKSQTNSDELIQKLAAGEDVDLHQVMIASEQADISFRVALAIRDKLVEAYRDVIHMNV